VVEIGTCLSTPPILLCQADLLQIAPTFCSNVHPKAKSAQISKYYTDFVNNIIHGSCSKIERLVKDPCNNQEAKK
jgi:hypothetical protein